MLLISYLNDFDEFLLDVSLDDDGPGVGVGQQLEGGVHRHLAVHWEEPVDGVGEVHLIHVRQGHGRVDLGRGKGILILNFSS